MRKHPSNPDQPSLFEPPAARKPARAEAQGATPPRPRLSKWIMPGTQGPDGAGRTVAEIRLRWSKRLTPAQAARVEAELSTLPRTLAKLGFGAVEVEHAFVRRRRS